MFVETIEVNMAKGDATILQKAITEKGNYLILSPTVIGINKRKNDFLHLLTGFNIKFDSHKIELPNGSKIIFGHTQNKEALKGISLTNICVEPYD